jgi:gluconolactonase
MFFAGWLLGLVMGCNVPDKPVKVDSAIGKVVLYDNAATAIIDTNASIQVIGRNYKWAEGPVWVPSKRMLLFSAVRENTIYRWNGRDTPVRYLTPSGYTDTAFRDGENGSNGLALDREGRLLLCQSGNRQLVRLNAPVDSPKALFTVLAANYRGKKFNSPNDLVVDSKDNIYFTDPIYGLPKHEYDPTRELTFEGVYRISADGKLTLLIDSISRPNGIALSNDEHTLYVGSSDDAHTRWYSFRIDSAGSGAGTAGGPGEGGGMLTGGRVLLDGTALKARAVVKQGADGFKIDKHGNLFAAGPDGINIISPGGKLLGLISIFGRPASNCAFNEEKDTLYITANDLLLRVPVGAAR